VTPAEPTCCLGDNCGDVIPASQAVLDATAPLIHPSAMTGPEPVTSPDVKVGLVALTLDEAMGRLHNGHSTDERGDAWRRCVVSTLCGEASRLLDGCELEMVAARMERGELT
jgi:hypothetical protein